MSAHHDAFRPDARRTTQEEEVHALSSVMAAETESPSPENLRVVPHGSRASTDVAHAMPPLLSVTRDHRPATMPPAKFHLVLHPDSTLHPQKGRIKRAGMHAWSMGTRRPVPAYAAGYFFGEGRART